MINKVSHLTKFDQSNMILQNLRLEINFQDMHTDRIRCVVQLHLCTPSAKQNPRRVSIACSQKLISEVYVQMDIRDIKFHSIFKPELRNNEMGHQTKVHQRPS